MFLACQVFAKAMIDAGRGGSIVNITSISSGPPLSKVFTYGVAKGGGQPDHAVSARVLSGGAEPEGADAGEGGEHF